MKSRIKSLLAVAIVSFTASAARADHVETSVRKSSAARPAVGASTAHAAVPTTTDEWRAHYIRQQAALAARFDGPVVRHVPMRPTTTDEARAEAIYRQAEIAARFDGLVVRRAAKKGYPTTTDEARGLY